jgi:hypothetical protein
MIDRRKKLAQKILIGLGLVWIAWAGWDQFADIPDDDMETHSSASVQERLRDCAGTFKQRYDCKEAIVIQVHRETFNNLIGRTAIVVVPPLLAAIGYGIVFRRRREEEHHDRPSHHHHTSGHW